jgi:uncharacterized protein (DUF2132 family)
VVLYLAALKKALWRTYFSWIDITMNDEIEYKNYKNNPLHGVGLKQLLVELEDCYGFEILFAYLNINCFKTNPSIVSSVTFLKKTDWAREKVESFYLYTFKNYPSASDEQFELPPRDRIVPDDQTAGEPAELSLEDAERLREIREKKSAEYLAGSSNNKNTDRSGRRSNNRGNDDRKSSTSSKPSRDPDLNPWGNPWGSSGE